jgi:hypothetical protein
MIDLQYGKEALKFRATDIYVPRSAQRENAQSRVVFVQGWGLNATKHTRIDDGCLLVLSERDEVKRPTPIRLGEAA